MDKFVVSKVAITVTESHELRPSVRLRHADARLRSSGGAAVVARRGFCRRGAVPRPALSRQALSRGWCSPTMPTTSCSANCSGCAGRPNCWLRSTCTRPAAKVLPSRPNMSGGCCRSRRGRRRQRGLDLSLQLARRRPAADRLGAVFGEVSFRVPDAVRRTSRRPAEPGPNLLLCNHGPRPGSAALHAAQHPGHEPSGALLRLGLLLHVGTQHRVDAALIAVALALEIVEHVFIDTNGDRLLPRRYNENRIRPVEIDRHGVRVVGDGLGDVFVCQRIDARPVSLALPRSPLDTITIFLSLVGRARRTR